MDAIDYTERTCIIVVEVDGQVGTIQIGIVVDSVSEVLNIKGEEIEEALPDVTLNLLVDAYIPDDYIEDAQDRMDMYRAISLITSLKDKTETMADMQDRFGKVPGSAQNLMDVAYLKHKCAQAGIKMVSERSDKYVLRLENELGIDMVKFVGLIGKYNARLSGQENPQVFLPKNDDGMDMLIGFAMGMLKLENH
jgi:transcription-repair coupling factor (superfamily II helicase)